MQWSSNNGKSEQIYTSKKKKNNLGITTLVHSENSF